ncbi:gliding motility lipoprotein GldH [Oscillatoria amoena NRMC-F 0135]|nr:gliding motility lipoprotein GldH [Oscillatoria amoena NRMC-F 0135]
MKTFLPVALAVILIACDASRVYEQNHDFTNRWWTVSEQPRFEFSISDTTVPYALYLNVRNESVYPYANLYVTYHLLDSAGKELHQKLITGFLFDKKSGKPLGQSGIGDIYDHRFLLLNNHVFPYSGRYTMRFEQFMRADTLKGILAVGLRVERQGEPH